MADTNGSQRIVKRTGIFTPFEPERCPHYAGIFHRLTRTEAEVLFWILFLSVIGLLIIASSFYARASSTLTRPENGTSGRDFQRRVRVKCFLISITCFCVALICVPTEALALLSIQFCDGEDLMMLYWGFWNLMQVGSLIAILGIAFQQLLVLSGKEEAPWNMSLGTPVLLMATIGHAVRTHVMSIVRNYRGRKVEPAVDLENMESENVALENVDVPPVQTRIDSRARHVGFTLDNEMLFAMPRAPRTADDESSS